MTGTLKEIDIFFARTGADDITYRIVDKGIEIEKARDLRFVRERLNLRADNHYER